MKNNVINILLVSMFLSFAAGLYAQSPDKVIPVPSTFRLSGQTYSFDEQPEVKVVLVKKGIGPEAYELYVRPDGVLIKASSESGVYYAHRTLDQMTSFGRVKELRCCEIKDAPRFPYRGLHVDVSRHFRSVEFLKKQLDAMAMFKMNRMHLHLTDAAGWRIQIDAYPRLTSFAAWRPQESWKDWWFGDRLYIEEGQEKAYGGYYTKEQIKDLVEYARQRHIEIIPEIEMPGHSEEVLAAYPELSCSGEAYGSGEFCIGNEKVFTFLEDVLTEVMEIFPSEYIHIGGDEANKEHWKNCPECQQRMKEENLEGADELQSYMIHRIDSFVTSKGKRIIGWDEILDGGLAPGATVMSWRGTEGGIRAMEQGHDVIMTPGRYCYLDHAQDAPFKEPESIGGYLPLDSVYVYEPLEESMPEDKLHHLVGLQANLWAEYIVTDSHAEYMYWPRAAAIAETAWSLPENKDVNGFRKRALHAMKQLRDMGYSTFDIEQEYGERKLAQTGLEHLAKGRKVTYNKPVQQWYPASGESTFTDGVIGGWTYSDGRWQGFLSDIDVVIDLDSLQTVGFIGGTFMQLKGPGVFMPEKVDIYISSDGQTYELVQTVWNDIPTSSEELLFKSFHVNCKKKARYIRYHAHRSTMRGFLFLDEIVVS